VKAIFFLLFAMVATTFGASALELTTRPAYACVTVGQCQ
jgi:hypothetical protein